jgi:hypothetical protein
MAVIEQANPELQARLAGTNDHEASAFHGESSRWLADHESAIILNATEPLRNSESRGRRA